ncbi:hypothetical protein JCM8547_005972 [Rhodosporidiobolus lusitaniae]
MESEHLDSGECAYAPLGEGLEKARERWEAVEEENWELRQRVGKLEGTAEQFVEELRSVRAALKDFLPSSSTFSTTPPSLPDALSSLSAAHTAVSQSFTSLSRSPTQHLSSTSHLADELASLRHAVGGLRLQMGGVMMEMQQRERGSYPYSPYIGQYGPSSGTGRARLARMPSSEGSDEGVFLSPGAVDLDGSSGSDEEGHASPFSESHPTWGSSAFFPRPGQAQGPFAVPFLPFPAGMRPVFPLSPGAGGEAAGMTWSGGAGAGAEGWTGRRSGAGGGAGRAGGGGGLPGRGGVKL